ncbi:MAG: hypothetical protein ACXWT7_05520, partial [Methylophilaceae bacterium]
KPPLVFVRLLHKEMIMTDSLQDPPRPPKIRFNLGSVVATPGALDALDKAATNAEDLLIRHMNWDWGDIPPEDGEQNDFAVGLGLRILSSYTLDSNVRIWIITEADRKVTRLLLPGEY